MSQEISGAVVEQASRRSVEAPATIATLMARAAINGLLPYWRPYQYRYWQFMYPYGGPMFRR